MCAEIRKKLYDSESIWRWWKHREKKGFKQWYWFNNCVETYLQTNNDSNRGTGHPIKSQDGSGQWLTHFFVQVLSNLTTTRLRIFVIDMKNDVHIFTWIEEEEGLKEGNCSHLIHYVLNISFMLQVLYRSALNYYFLFIYSVTMSWRILSPNALRFPKQLLLKIWMSKEF